jgi:hypothetical protein
MSNQSLFALNDLLDDLDAQQMTQLINWLWVNQYTASRANIQAWRKRNNLSND